jgi:FKBP-type peptidyl-prolyl cis-trans isomerase FklB
MHPTFDAMKLKLLSIALISTLLATAQDHKHYDLKTQTDSLSYALGMNVASSLKQNGFDSLRLEVFLQAMEDVMVKNHVVMDATTSNNTVNAYVKQKKEAVVKAAKEKEVEFLTKNAQRKDVKVLPSGLQYRVLQQGTGPKPVDGQKVTTHYKGTLLDGTVFDSSIDRGQPATFGLNGVIRGWTEILKMMPVGSKYEVFIPFDLAYGERAMGKIQPYSTLIFEIELLEIAE